MEQTRQTQNRNDENLNTDLTKTLTLMMKTTDQFKELAKKICLLELESDPNWTEVLLWLNGVTLAWQNNPVLKEYCYNLKNWPWPDRGLAGATVFIWLQLADDLGVFVSLVLLFTHGVGRSLVIDHLWDTSRLRGRLQGAGSQGQHNAAQHPDTAT